MNLFKYSVFILLIISFNFFFITSSMSVEKISDVKTVAVENEKPVKEIENIKKKYPNAIKTTSGLMYLVLKEGTGPVPANGALIEAHYTGRLVDGTKFDSSVDRGQPFRFLLGRGEVIRGWDEAFLAMKKGEKRLLIIPPDLAYGEKGMGSIPPNATLIFEVELIYFIQ